jgi:protein-S-isoprenylcysteine O-methyltransferase Ste14
VNVFRPARPAGTAWNVAKTLLGLLVVWFVFLFLMPLGVSIVEIELGIQRFPPQYVAAALLLLASTVLGVWAALTIAVAGQGTPIPFDGVRKIVVSGPYAFIRYPLAVAGAGQMVAIGLSFGSVPVLMYATLAMALWYYLIRPAAERDLATRFGESWRDYTRGVRGFRPRLTPYRPTIDRY